MKVGLLNVELEISGGTERLMAIHANALKRAGHEPVILCAYYKPSVFPEEFKKFRIVEYAKTLEKLKIMHRTRVSVSLLNKNLDFLKSYDRLVCYRPYTNVLAMRAKKKYGMKVLWYCNHPEKNLYPKYFKTLNKLNLLFRLALLPGLKADQESIKKIDMTYTNSHHMWTKLSLIYNHLNHKVLYPPGRLMKKSKRGEYIISISRIQPEKNQMLLLEALSKLSKKIKTAIIGKLANQEYFEKCQSYVKKHKLKVEFTGELTDNEIQEWYDKSFLNVYTSYDEDFGMVPLESISSGKPSLTHVSNGVSEVLPQRYVFSHVNELARKINEIKEGRIKNLTAQERNLPIKIKKDHLTEIITDLEKE